MFLRSVHRNGDEAVFQVSILDAGLSVAELQARAEAGTLFGHIPLSVDSLDVMADFKAVQRDGLSYSLSFSSDDAYYVSYDNLEVHETMLRDTARLQFYELALKLIGCKGQRVLDVGAGSGILSLLALRNGAAHVACSEASARLRSVLPAIFRANQCAEGAFSVHGRVEDMSNVGQFDVIVSEWMGFHLLHEGMLDSFLHARDTLLRPGGVLIPSVAQLYCAVVCSRESFQWQSVMGQFDLTALRDAFGQPPEQPWYVRTDRWLPASSVSSPPVLMRQWDLYKCTREDVSLADAVVNVEVGGGDAIAVYFVVRAGEAELDTGPWGKETQWNVSLVRLPEGFFGKARVSVLRNAEDHRKYDIEIGFL